MIVWMSATNNQLKVAYSFVSPFTMMSTNIGMQSLEVQINIFLISPTKDQVFSWNTHYETVLWSSSNVLWLKTNNCREFKNV